MPREREHLIKPWLKSELNTDHDESIVYIHPDRPLIKKIELKRSENSQLIALTLSNLDKYDELIQKILMNCPQVSIQIGVECCEKIEVKGLTQDAIFKFLDIVEENTKDFGLIRPEIWMKLQKTLGEMIVLKNNGLLFHATSVVKRFSEENSDPSSSVFLAELKLNTNLSFQSIESIQKPASWIKGGTFELLYEGFLNRWVEYRHNGNPLIKEIQLFSDHSGKITMSLSLSNSTSCDELRLKISNKFLGTSIQEEIVSLDKISVKNLTHNIFPELLNIVEINTQNFNLIRQEIEGHLQYLIEEQEKKESIKEDSSVSLLDVFMSALAPRYDEANKQYFYHPLYNDLGLNKLVKYAQKLIEIYPQGKILSLGQSPAWLIAAASLVQPSEPNRFDGVAFSGAFYEKKSKEEMFVKTISGPTFEQINTFRDYLSQKKLDPFTISQQFSPHNPCVFVEHIQSGKGLVSFLSILLDWADELGVREKIQNSVKIHILLTENFTVNRFITLGLAYSIQNIENDFMIALANSDEFDDRLLPNYSFYKWEKGFYPQFCCNISNNAQLILNRVECFIKENILINQEEKINSGQVNIKTLVDNSLICAKSVLPPVDENRSAKSHENSVNQHEFSNPKYIG